jgi:integrase
MSVECEPVRLSCYQREMKDVLKRAGIIWHGWHGYRRALASNLNRLGVDDSVIQRILHNSNAATTQNHYIKTASPDAIAAKETVLRSPNVLQMKRAFQEHGAVVIAKFHSIE